MTVNHYIECNVSGCSREKGKRRGMCDLHYRRWIEYGSTDPRRNSLHKGINERLWDRLSKDADGCWRWTGALNNKGYGTTSRPRPEGYVGRTPTVYAHRLAWEEVNGPIPDGMVIDHICHEPRCANPDHLRLATHRQNQRHRRGAQIDSKTGILNVHPHTDGAYAVQVGGKHIGLFRDLEKAAAVANAVRLEMYGEFASPERRDA